MSWLGMSIPVIPGTTGSRPRTAPGTRNKEKEKERDKQRQSENETPSHEADDKPSVNPAPKPNLPGPIPRTSPSKNH